MMDSLADDIADQLSKYTACDISDALLKLQSPGAGFLANLKPYTLNLRHPVKITIAPVSTVLFAPKGVDLLEPANNIPEGKHWADLTKPGTIVVMKQPEGQSNAIFGGIMALRMTACEAHGIIVAGRVRDLAELRGTSIPIWGYASSTVGSGGGSVPWATQVPLQIGETLVAPGDIAFLDAVNGVVIIPRHLVERVVALLPQITEADEKVKQDVLKGMSVYDAFKLHRG